MSKENILVICRQNIGRSQMGEGFLKALTYQDPEINVRSAGLDTTGMKEKYNNHPHPKVISVMQELGVDISQQEITQVNPDLLKDSSRIVVLAKEQELPDYFIEYQNKMVIFPVEDPEPGPAIDVDMQRLRETRDQIKQIISQISIK